MHHHWDLKLARERLCKEAKLQNCNERGIEMRFLELKTVNHLAEPSAPILQRCFSCIYGRFMLRICNVTLNSNALGFTHSPTYRTFHYPRIDQSIDAVIYVTVVFVLFAAIVLLLVGTGCHRYQPVNQGSSGERRQLVVRFEDGGTSQSNPEVPVEPV